MKIDQALKIALSHHEAGRLDAARDLYAQILSSKPNHAETLQYIAIVCIQQSQPAQAADWIEKALALDPDHPANHYIFGTALKGMGKSDHALKEFETAVRLAPKFINALNALAEEYLDRKRVYDAIPLLRQSVEIDPFNPITLHLLGIALHGIGQLHEAADAYKKAAALLPNAVEIHNNLGIVLNNLGELDESLESFKKAVAIEPNRPNLLNNLGNAYKNLACHEQAVGYYRRAINVQPEYSQAWSNLLFEQLYTTDFNPRQYKADLDQWVVKVIAPIPRRTSHSNDRSPNRKLKIGFLSPDFREHPVGRFMIALLRNIDRQNHEIFLYHDNPINDPIASILQPLSDQWRQTPALSDEQLDQLIVNDRIDILFDLAAHTANNRLKLFARKPAPVQVSWLAYCGTTGVGAIDYRLADRLMDPPGMSDMLCSEKTIYLPHCYWLYQPSDEAPDPVCPDFPVVFGCLNNFCKLNPPLLGVFAQILSRVPNSALLLHAQQGSHRDGILKTFQSAGVDPARIRFVPKTSIGDYFALYNQIHIALDPFPYNGGATTCDALWMGVPVVSLVGNDRPTALAGKSILENLNLGELLADSTEQYIDIAVNLARDQQKVTLLRNSLRQRMLQSPLMDGQGFSRDFASILRTLWLNWLNHDP